MIEFRFEKLRRDGNELETNWDLLLRLVADFSIIVPDAHIPLYREEEFCVVEFAMQITQWLATLHTDLIDFSYNSIESDETGLVSIRKQQHGWTVAALHQDVCEDRPFSTEDIEKGVGEFIARLKKEVPAEFSSAVRVRLAPASFAGSR